MITLRSGLLLVLATSALACASSDAAHDPDAAGTGSVQQETGAACDRSPYNCKVPNAESIPAGIDHDTNRAFNHFDQSYFWPLVGEPPLRDGEGQLRGYVKGGHDGHDHEVKLNFGERKHLGGVQHVYAFSVMLIDGHSVSGWIPESSVKRQATLAKMPTVSPNDPGTPYYDEDWVVTGGDLKSDHTTLALNEKYGDLRVNPNVTDAEHASDYLVRQWDAPTQTGFVNFLYNLPHSGGVANDTLPMCVHFKRFKGVDQLETKLWFTASSSESKLILHFVYGTIGGRRGWITHEMLTPAGDLASLDPSDPCHPTQGKFPPAQLPTPPAPPSPSTPSTPPTRRRRRRRRRRRPLRPRPSRATFSVACRAPERATSASRATTRASAKPRRSATRTDTSSRRPRTAARCSLAMARRAISSAGRSARTGSTITR
jgi:hypothetical protein